MSRTQAVSAMTVALVALVGCGEGGGGTMSPAPMVPGLAPGMAMLAGRVLSADQMPIAGAAVSIASVTNQQSGAMATTDAEGRFRMTVPGDTTVTPRADAAGFTRALGNSIIIPSGTMSEGFDLLMLPTDRMMEFSAKGGTRTDYGAIAVDVLSLAGACDPVGGKITIAPAEFGKVFHTKAGTWAPDETVTTVEAAARPTAWILGVVPPGTYYRLKFEKPGCTEAAMPLDFAGRNYTGHLPVETKAVSHATIFVP
jgi:Carboxypeptidase regulatory-like domain